MFVSEVTTSGNIIDCSVSLTGNRIVILTNMGIEAYEWDFRSKPPTVARLIASFSMVSQPISSSNARFRQIALQREDIIRLLSHPEGGASQISTYAIEESSKTLKDLDVDIVTSNDDQDFLPHNLYTDINHQSTWFQTKTSLKCMDHVELSLSSTVYPWTEIVVVERHEQYFEEVNGHFPDYGIQSPKHTHIFTLSRKGELFANDKLLTRGCTSFVSTTTHLLFTTSLHLLKFVHIDTSNGKFENPTTITR
jgi:elongator complex protein 1